MLQVGFLNFDNDTVIKTQYSQKVFEYIVSTSNWNPCYRQRSLLMPFLLSSFLDLCYITKLLLNESFADKHFNVRYTQC